MRIVREVRRHGVGTIAQLAAGKVLTKAAAPAIKRYSKPSVLDLVQASGHMTTSVTDALGELGFDDIMAVNDEFDRVYEDLRHRYAETNLPFPGKYAIGSLTARLLYSVVRQARPATIVETGVFQGHSSFVLLAALQANGSGHLHSFEVNKDSGEIVDTRDRWTLFVNDRERAEESFKDALTAIGPVDVYFHDADHRYLGQKWEYETVWPYVRDGGLFASDDIDCSQAFVEFCSRLGERPTLMIDGVRAIGAFRRNGRET
jgi:predicted O-methyltransferase YrrM